MESLEDQIAKGLQDIKKKLGEFAKSEIARELGGMALLRHGNGHRIESYTTHSSSFCDEWA